MTSESSAIPEYLNPEYWDNHHKEDDCPIHRLNFREVVDKGIWSQSKKEQKAMIAKVSTEIELLQLLGKDTVLHPIAEFHKGTTLVLNKYPNGTLIRVTSEGMILSHESPEGTYDVVSLHGLIVDVEGIVPEASRAILYIQGNTAFGGNTEDINIGEVQHDRYDHGQSEIDYLNRVTQVDILSIGGGTKTPNISASPSPSFYSAALSPAS